MEHINKIGTILKLKREEQGLKIQDIAFKTKINVNVLKLLEENDLKKLPNKTYVKGFVKSYSSFVGLDIKESLEILESNYSEMLGTSKPVDTAHVHLGSLQSENLEESESEEMKETFLSIVHVFFTKKLLYLSIAVFVVFLIIKGITTFFSNLNFEKEIVSKPEISTEVAEVESPELKAPEENILQMESHKELLKEVVEKEKATAPVEAEKEVLTKIDPKDEPVKEIKKIVKVVEEEEDEKEAEKKESITLPAGKFPFKKFYPAPRDMYELSKDSTEVNDPNLLPPSIKSSNVDGKQNVYIVATEEDTWISYKVDDEPIKRYVLKQGKRVLIKGDKVLLFMGNFNSVKVFYNNSLVTADTKTGVKSMIFPESIAGDYELPLFPSYKGIPYTTNEYKNNMIEETATN